MLIGLIVAIFVSAYKLLQLLGAKARVASREALLLKHLLYSLLEGGKPLSLLADDVLIEVLQPLVDPCLNGCLIVLGNLYTIRSALTQLGKALVVTNLQSPTDAFAAKLEETRIGSSCLLSLD